MDLDVDISRWVLELLLSERRMDTIAKRVLAVAPLPVHHDWRLKKSLLLRIIESTVYDDVSVTETILQALEDIEALDRRQGILTTATMRAAYCAVATECTVKFLICFGRKYLEAVDRIWRGRVRVLESERSELVTAELKERWNEVEAGIWDREVSRKIVRMNTRNDALKLVVAYVKEAWDSMGPPFLAYAVKFDMAKESGGGGGGGNVGDGCGEEVQVANGNELKVKKANGGDLCDGSKLEADGGNVGDGCKAELQMERDGKVFQGSEMLLSNGVCSNSEAAIEVASTNRDDVGVGKELKGQRENGANVSDGCGKEARIVSGNELKVQAANGGDLGDGSKPEAKGGNVGDGCRAEVQMERDSKGGQGSELEVSTGACSKSESAIEVALTNGENVDVGRELKGQREIGANVNDESGVKTPMETWRVGKYNAGEVTVAVPRFGSLLGFHKGNGILHVVGPRRSAPNVNRGVLSFEPATKERDIPCAVPLRHKHEPFNIQDVEYVGRDASDGIHNDVSTEVRKVQQELKSSVMALQAVVTDPHDLHVLEIVKSELRVNHLSVEIGITKPSVEKNTEPDQSCDTHGNLTSGDQKDVPQATGKEYDAPSSSVDKGLATEYVRSGDPYSGDLCCSNQKNCPRPGLMERNSTAHTYKWDDSIGMSPEGTVMGRVHQPIPKQNANSLLKTCEAKRRKVKRWSIHEADTLRTAVKEYGQGNWKAILDAYRDVFEERTEVDLKDKWRNMSK